ncbi:hypothetical protein Q8F55_004194 [Vanrija albida]|uniref:Uncharacterized protein n=1 Tax=Vanrija albida TaxID=181172 RepID=A0ABR3Q625_9TREE
MPSPTGTTTPPTASTSAAPSPTIAPLHNPAQAALVVPPQAPLGSTHPNTVVPGASATPAALGAKALLAKKFAKPSTVSPTDALQSPCTQKLADAKGRRFSNKGKPATSLASRLSAAQDENAQ